MKLPPRTRLLALIGVLPGERRATHTGKFPLIPEKMLPLADVVVLVADDDPGAMLFRYTAHGEFGGDTLHPTVEDAQESGIATLRKDERSGTYVVTGVASERPRRRRSPRG